jgi:hypothetical protein
MHKRVCAALAAVLLTSVVGLSGCSATPRGATSNVSRATPVPRIAAPPVNVGQWYDLGVYRAPWLAGDGPVAAHEASTRVMGWKRESASKDKDKDTDKKDEWLALVIVQVAQGAYAPCSAQPTSLDVMDAGGGCLRLRRNADFDRWLQVAQPALYQWVDDHGWTSLPRAWAGYRLPSANGGAIEVHALFLPSLIEPTTRNTTDFLTSGLPGQQWARELAEAARALDGTANSAVLAVPPFPFSPGPRTEMEAALPDMLPTEPGAAASTPEPAAAPALAEQVTPAPPREPSPSNPAPRKDGR